MNTQKGIALAVLALMFAAALLWGFGFGKSSEITLKSDDGSVTLSIPNDALPDGTKAESLSMRALAPEEFFGSTTETLPGSAYALLPDGLVFTKPITLRTNIKQNGVIPQLFHVSASGTELVAPSAVRFTENNIESEFTLTHFSEVGLDTLHGIFRYELTTGGSAQVGQTLPYGVTITPNQQEQYFMRGVGWAPDVERLRANARRGIGYREARRELALVEAANEGGYFYKVAPGTVYTVKAFDVTNSGTVLTPSSYQSPEKAQKEYEQFQFTVQFTCARPGVSRPTSRGTEILYRMRTREHKNDGTLRETVTYQGNSTLMSFYAKDYTCLAPPTGPEGERIEAIGYDGKHIPVSQLIIENETGCGGAHYHAANGRAVATDGTELRDPGPPCGYGKVSERPTISVAAPAPQTVAPSPAPPPRKPSGAVMTVCGLPGGPACPKR